MNEGGRNLAQLFLQSDILYIYSNICSSVSSNFKVASSLPPTNGQNKVQNVNQFENYECRRSESYHLQCCNLLNTYIYSKTSSRD